MLYSRVYPIKTYFYTPGRKSNKTLTDNLIHDRIGLSLFIRKDSIMKQEDVKVGMKVKIYKKSIEGGFFQYRTFRQWKQFYGNQPFSVVEKIHIDTGKENVFVIDNNWFLASDFEPYEEQPEPKKIPFTVIMPL